ncbi:unnamed protein product [Moneuplotes crassus]|uniref:Uncharacterized protein n=1 Tax=Euplotes crassus TaxID=5936 RepID=A0AAD1U9F0_EUPCR|nr:unnamed protein product [Moneuplotes crassus]
MSQFDEISEIPPANGLFKDSKNCTPMMIRSKDKINNCFVNKFSSRSPNLTKIPFCLEENQDFFMKPEVNYCLHEEMTAEQALDEINKSYNFGDTKVCRRLIKRFPGIFTKFNLNKIVNIFFNAIRRKDILMVKTVINDCKKCGDSDLIGLMSLTDDNGNNCSNIMFLNLWINILKSCSVIDTITHSVNNLRVRYDVCNNYNKQGMTAVLECANSGETEAIMYMKHLNMKQKALIFDFSMRNRETNESVYHLAAKNDQYHIIELFPDTNANILSLDREFRTPRQVSTHTLLLLVTLCKIEKKTVREIIHKRKVKNKLYGRNKSLKLTSSKRTSQTMDNSNSEVRQIRNFGSLFPHFLMNKANGMQFVTDISYKGECIEYSKSYEICSYSQIINDNWEKITPKQKRELLKRRLLHQNLISCQKKRSSISFSSTATSTQFINSKLSSRMSLLASSKRRKPNDDEISIEF